MLLLSAAHPGRSVCQPAVPEAPAFCSSVEAFAGEVLAKDWPIHCLINNAGVFLVKHHKTEDGFEVCLSGEPALQQASSCL